MYFCPLCNYLFDITKSSISTQKDTRKEVDKIVDLFKLIEENKDLTKYKAVFDKNELLKNKKYQKMTDVEKLNIKQIFDDILDYGAIFKCNRCGNIENIVDTTLLFQISLNNNKQIKTIKENKLLCNNPILPRTKDYNCKNINCETHNNENIKEAVFYKDKNSYKINYICCVCNFGW
jgi:hypothetical protein